MPSHPLTTSTHLNLPTTTLSSSTTMPLHSTNTVSKPKPTSSLLSRLNSGSFEKWGESSEVIPSSTGSGMGMGSGIGSGSIPPQRGPEKRVGVMSWPTTTTASTSASASTKIITIPPRKTVNKDDQIGCLPGTQETLTWSPSPDRPRSKATHVPQRRAGLPTPPSSSALSPHSHHTHNQRPHPPSSSGSRSDHSAYSQQIRNYHPRRVQDDPSQTSPTRQPKFSSISLGRGRDERMGSSVIMTKPPSTSTSMSTPTPAGIRPLKIGLGSSQNRTSVLTSTGSNGSRTLGGGGGIGGWKAGIGPPSTSHSLAVTPSRSRSRSRPANHLSTHRVEDAGQEVAVMIDERGKEDGNIRGMQVDVEVNVDVDMDMPLTTTKPNEVKDDRNMKVVSAIAPSTTITTTTYTTPKLTKPSALMTPEEKAEKERAKESRRRAMMAAMNSMSSSPVPTTTRVPPIASSSKLTSTSREGSPLVRPGSGSGSGMKRGLGEVGSVGNSTASAPVMPWEANGIITASKVMATIRPLPIPTTARGANTDSTLNIRQKVILSSEQRSVLNMVVDQGRSVFFTGSAGTGKSVLLREIIRALKKKYAGRADAVAVTASTGIAACNIGGVTIHSFGGIGLGAETPEKLCMNIRKNKKALSRWTRTQVLIMDEVSMVDGDLFDKLSKIGSILRKKPDRPFGGIQIVVTGDFFQLPPVTKHNKSPTFAFEAATWNDTVTASVNLTKVFRQRDQTFVNMLNEMRFGKMTKASIDRFAGLRREVVYTDGIEPTELFPRREDVEKANQTRLQQLKSETWEFVATDGPGPPSESRSKILQNMMAAENIVLKLNAQVMLIKNVDETLVNGSMGKVIGFCEKHLYREDMLNRWVGEVMPDESDGDDSVGEDGAPKKKRKTSTGPKPPGDKRRELLPVVSFRVPGGVRDVLVEKDTFKTELPNGEIQASRLQLPLILAWAMSIHKSQGQTLDRVKVDLSRVFEKGQAYVALSRATSLEGLQVTGFNPAKVMAHPKVTAWSQNLVTYE